MRGRGIVASVRVGACLKRFAAPHSDYLGPPIAFELFRPYSMQQVYQISESRSLRPPPGAASALRARAGLVYGKHGEATFHPKREAAGFACLCKMSLACCSHPADHRFPRRSSVGKVCRWEHVIVDRYVAWLSAELFGPRRIRCSAQLPRHGHEQPPHGMHNLRGGTRSSFATHFFSSPDAQERAGIRQREVCRMPRASGSVRRRRAAASSRRVPVARAAPARMLQFLPQSSLIGGCCPTPHPGRGDRVG